jgi:hypothetical protein
MWHIFLFLLLLLGSAGYALWRGGAPEQIAAVNVIAGTAGSIIAASRAPIRWMNVEVGLLAIDTMMLAVVILLLIRANRLWPIFMAAMLIDQIAGHFLRALDPHLYPFLYWLTSSLWSYLVLITLVIATRGHRLRLKRFGRDESWASSSRMSRTEGQSSLRPD